MICIRCGVRSGGERCRGCGGEFAFSFGAGDRGSSESLTDKLFARTLVRVSSEGKLRFTVGQLYYELRRSYGPLTQARFDELWARWQVVHGAPAGLVTPWPARDAASVAPEPDIGDYSFERVVITDSAWMVDFLLWNNLHFETNSAVLSIDGYPEDRFELIRGMLHKNPQIIVIALHDASVEGCALAGRLLHEDGWFRDHGYVIDVGLGPAHRDLYEGMWRERDAPVEPAKVVELTGVAEGPEAQWLSSHVLDLAVVRPEKVMRRLFRATRQYADRLTEPDGPRMGEVYLDNELLGAGRHKRVAYGEVLR